MGEKVIFATSNWKNKADKPSQMTQAEWDAYHSSKFNGFPFATVEKDEEGNAFSLWDGTTKFEDKPSKSSSKRVSVFGNHYSFKFTKDQLFQIFWRMSEVKPVLFKTDESGEVTTARTDYRDSSYTATTTSLTAKSTKSNQKNLESKLVSELATNYWNLDINGCKFGIDFNMPVLKTTTGETDEYWPFVNCTCCKPVCGPGMYYDHYGSFEPFNAATSYEITKAQYDSFQLGGTINLSASIDINYNSQLNCSWSKAASIIVSPNSCNGSANTYIWEYLNGAPATCFSNPYYYSGMTSPSEESGSSMGLAVIVFAEGGKYYLYTSGYIQCPVGNGTASCVRTYRHMGKRYSTGETNSFSFLGVNIYYDDNSQYSSNSWSMSFTPRTPNA